MFINRQEAGRLLAEKLSKDLKEKDFLLVGILRGGVVVAREISRYFSKPLKALVIKKIPSPQNIELALGAIAPSGIYFFDQRILKNYHFTKSDLLVLLKEKRKEVGKIEKLFGSIYSLLKNKVIVLVDDGVATGSTVVAASEYLEKAGAAKIILAAPVVSADTYVFIKKYFASIVCLEKPKTFFAVGEFYSQFPQVEGEEAMKILQEKFAD